MDAEKTGALIRALRMEQGLTQAALAERLHVTDKAVSKWERGQGCPDLPMLPALAGVFQVSVESILAGELRGSERNGGNMKRIRFYCCPVCGNVMTATGEAEIACCGRRLEAMPMRPCDEAHTLRLEEMDGETYVSLAHEMSKAHHIRFIAQVGFDRVTLVRLYPEQDAETRLPRMGHGRLYIGCSRDGLYWQNF